MPTTVRTPHAASGLLALAVLLLAGSARGEIPRTDPFARFDLPDAWEATFWASPNARALLRLSPRAIADLVPTQAGIRFCRCPACDAPESEDPLGWSVEHPESLACRRCGAKVPKEKEKGKGKAKENDSKGEETGKGGKEDEKPKTDAEDAVEVLPGVIHKYPYHEVEPEHQRYPEERLYLAAKRDYQVREFLSKAALYAAVRYHEQPSGRKDVALARASATILLRFAQVYPAYATHFDQPESPKYFDKADLPPPYRRGYRTAKWDWSGSLDVPLNLVIAYALLRDDPALVEAGRLLREPEPARAVERDLFRASAEFVRRQPEEYTEAALQADRGILAVGRLLDDPTLTRDAVARLERFSMRGFYHDGFWRDGTLSAHKRVLGHMEGWIDRLLIGQAAPPMLTLAHQAGSAVLTDRTENAPEVVLASWPAPVSLNPPRGPVLLGGAGLARLSLGRGSDAFDLELRGLDSPGPDRIERQALRVAVGGRTALGDLDEGPRLGSGFDRASVSRNTVIVDGLNQRESPARAREPAVGGDFLFYAADPDFQVVTLDDSRSYPTTTSRYRQTLVATSGKRSRYAVGVFEVVGGLQHDQLFHGPSGSASRWRLSVPTTPGPATLMPPGLTAVPSSRAEDGRWFVQAYGQFLPISVGTIPRPAQAWLAGPGADPAPGGVRLHLLTDTPLSAVTATSPDAPGPPREFGHDDSGRGSLILRRKSTDGTPLRTTFVTLFEPVSAGTPALTRVARVPSTAGTVVVYVESEDGPEYLVVNNTPGAPAKTTLPDGRDVESDGVAVRVSSSGLVLAGGTFARYPGLAVRQKPVGGRVVWSARNASAGSRGWFESDTPVPEPESVAGRVLLVRHGDGITRGWTLDRVENTPDGARLLVREEPGFLLDPATGIGRYYQYPHTTHPGPHRFRIARIAR